MVTPGSQTCCAFAVAAMLGGLVEKPFIGEIILYSFLGGTEICSLLPRRDTGMRSEHQRESRYRMERLKLALFFG